MNNILVIYHSADFDGLFSREICRDYLGDSADYLGWDYGDPKPELSRHYNTIFMVDISIDGLMDDPRLVWIDHHISAINKYSSSIRGYRIDGVAACRLAYQYFFGDTSATLNDFKSRKVKEPYAVTLAGEYDIWDKTDPNTDVFQLSLKSKELSDSDWRVLVRDKSKLSVKRLIPFGQAVDSFLKKENKYIADKIAFDLQFEGLNFLAMNRQGNSQSFDCLDQNEYDALLLFYWVKTKWKVSMYHTSHNRDVDLSIIASKYGGGGHKGACGFECEKLPFNIK